MPVAARHLLDLDADEECVLSYLLSAHCHAKCAHVRQAARGWRLAVGGWRLVDGDQSKHVTSRNMESDKAHPHDATSFSHLLTCAISSDISPGVF